MAYGRFMVVQHPHGAGALWAPEYRIITVVSFRILSVEVWSFFRRRGRPHSFPDDRLCCLINNVKTHYGLQAGLAAFLCLCFHFPRLPKDLGWPKAIINSNSRYIL